MENLLARQQTEKISFSTLPGGKSLDPGQKVSGPSMASTRSPSP